LRELRQQLGISQVALGEKLGVTAQQIQKYETGANRVSASMLYAAAGVLQVRVGYFFEDLPDPSAAPTSAAWACVRAMQVPPTREERTLTNLSRRISHCRSRRAIVGLMRAMAATPPP